MRIVLDTKSKGWQTFKRWGLGVFIILLIMIVFGALEKLTGYDTDFMCGYFVASAIYFYEWRDKL